METLKELKARLQEKTAKEFRWKIAEYKKFFNSKNVKLNCIFDCSTERYFLSLDYSNNKYEGMNTTSIYDVFSFLESRKNKLKIS